MQQPQQAQRLPVSPCALPDGPGQSGILQPVGKGQHRVHADVLRMGCAPADQQAAPEHVLPVGTQVANPALLMNMAALTQPFGLAGGVDIRETDDGTCQRNGRIHRRGVLFLQKEPKPQSGPFVQRKGGVLNLPGNFLPALRGQFTTHGIFAS